MVPVLIILACLAVMPVNAREQPLRYWAVMMVMLIALAILCR